MNQIDIDNLYIVPKEYQPPNFRITPPPPPPPLLGSPILKNLPFPHLTGKLIIPSFPY